MADSETLSVRVSEFATGRSVNIQLSRTCTVGELKRKISERHERKPAANQQRLVLLGKPLNDESAVVRELIEAKGIDPSTTTTVHLVVSEPVAQSCRHASSAPNLASTLSPSRTTTTAAAAISTPPPPAGASPAASGPSSHPVPHLDATEASSPVPPSPPSQSKAATQGSPALQLRPMMHPIMAAAYNAALLELSSSSCNSQRTAAHVTDANGQQQTVPFALSTPIHLSDPRSQVYTHGHGIGAAGAGIVPSTEQTVIINTNTVNLTGNNADSLASLLTRANVRMRVLPNGQRPGGVAPGGVGAAAADAAAAAGGGAGAAGVQAPAAQPQVGGFRLQLNFQLNLLQVLRLGLVVVFMHSVMQMSTVKIVLLLTAYFIGRTLIGIRLHRALTAWLDRVIAYTQQHPGGQPPAADQRGHQGEPERPPQAGAGGAGGAAGAHPADAAADAHDNRPSAAAADGGAAPQQQQQQQDRPGVLWQIWVGFLSFFLSMLPQFNANGADADAIAAAQEDLDNAGNNGAAMAF